MLWIENPNGRFLRADVITEVRPRRNQPPAGMRYGDVAADCEVALTGACEDEQHARRLAAQLVGFLHTGGDGVLRHDETGFRLDPPPTSDFTAH